MLEGAALERREQLIDVGDQDIARMAELHGEASIQHVRAGHALVDEARLGADEFGEMGQERDHVVLGDALDRLDALDVELRLAPFSQIAFAASFGMIPISAIASDA